MKLSYVATSDITLSLEMSCGEVNRLIRFLQDHHDAKVKNDDDEFIWVLNDTIQQFKTIYSSAADCIELNSKTMKGSYDV